MSSEKSYLDGFYVGIRWGSNSSLKQSWTCQSRSEKFGHQATATRILAHNMRVSQIRQLPSHLRNSKLEMKFQTISHIN